MVYDYIILGGGAASLSLAYRMVHNSYFADKRIALIEPDDKNKNDRTWCYWEKGKGPFDAVVHKQWNQLSFYGEDGEVDLDLGPYTYKMIRGIDFYDFVIPAVKNSGIDWIAETVTHVEEEEDVVKITTSEQVIEAKQVFQSFLLNPIEKSDYIYVDQHFKGFEILCDQPVFDADRATFMDFRIEQGHDTRFMYVLPTSAHEALVELAVFSNDIWTDEEYNDYLLNYISDTLEIHDYTVKEEEFGIIPMTNYPFDKGNSDRILMIGSAGGAVKPSSGYAFQRIQQHADKIIHACVHGQSLQATSTFLFDRFHRYDEVFLDALLGNGTSGKEVFTRLFSRRKAYEVFKFLNQETHLGEELQIFTAPPFGPFLKSFFKTM